MADKLQGGIVAGTTSLSIPFSLYKVSDGTEQTGKVAGDMVGSYWRQGEARTAITLSDLGSITSAYSSGGVKELDSTNDPGSYRLDVPDAALVTGADWVEFAIKVNACLVAKERYALESVGSKANNTSILAIKAKTDLLPSALQKNVSVTITFEVRSAASPGALLPGVTPTILVSKDGGVFASAANAPAEISGLGVWKLVLTAGEMNADLVMLYIQATGGVTYTIRIYTKA